MPRSRALGHGLELSVEGKNLTDRRVQDFGGYPLPGRAWFVHLRYSRS
jgi:outer membrane receptor protein involved in Fe transport